MIQKDKKENRDIYRYLQKVTYRYTKRERKDYK